MKKNSIDKIIEKTYSEDEQILAGDNLLAISSKYANEALADPFGWTQSMALLFRCELNRVTK